MLSDGLEFTPGSRATGFAPDSGTAFPQTPTDGQLFRLTASVGPLAPGVYWYEASTDAWVTGDITSVAASTGLSGGGTRGALSLSLDLNFTDARYSAAFTLGTGLASNGTDLFIDRAYENGVNDLRYLGLGGGTLTSALTLPGSPTLALHAATKGYVDTARASALGLSGGTMTGDLTLAGDPTADLHAATKGYVDALAQGLDPKASVRGATVSNITLSGLQTHDGVALGDGDRELVKNQTMASQNGIYVVHSGAWARASDANSSAKVTSGMYCFVEEGTVNAATGWNLLTRNAVLGTTSLVFTQFGSATAYSAGSGIGISGGVISATPYTAGSGITVASNVISATPYTAGPGVTVSANVVSAAVYDIAGSVKGKPAAGDVIGRFEAVRPFSIPAGLTSSVSKAGSSATASAALSLAKNGTIFGTMTFAAAGTVATVAAASSTTFAATDVLTIVAPATADATLADIAFTIVATLT